MCCRSAANPPTITSSTQWCKMKRLVLMAILSSFASIVPVVAADLKAHSAPVSAAVATVAEDKQQKSDLVNKLLSEQSYLNSQIVDKCFTFNFSPTAWSAFNNPGTNPNETGAGAMNFWIQFVVEYAKREKIGDFMQLEVSDKEVEKANRPAIDEMINKLRSRFSLTVDAPLEIKGKAYEMMMRYPYQVLERIGQSTPEWSPASGQAHFTTKISATAKDIAVTISPDGKRFTVVGPAYTEAYDTKNKIYNGLERANKNR